MNNDKRAMPIELNMAVMGNPQGEYYLGFSITHGMMQSTFALDLNAVDALIKNLPEARAALNQTMLGLVVPQQTAAPRNVKGR